MDELSYLTKKELKHIIKEYNLHHHIKGYSAMSKEQLLHAISMHLVIQNGVLMPSVYNEINYPAYREKKTKAKNNVVMKKKDVIKEHNELIPILQHGTHQEQLKEAEKQLKELQHIVLNVKEKPKKKRVLKDAKTGKIIPLGQLPSKKPTHTVTVIKPTDKFPNPVEELKKSIARNERLLDNPIPSMTFNDIEKVRYDTLKLKQLYKEMAGKSYVKFANRSRPKRIPKGSGDINSLLGNMRTKVSDFKNALMKLRDIPDF